MQLSGEELGILADAVARYPQTPRVKVLHARLRAEISTLKSAPVLERDPAGWPVLKPVDDQISSG
jgi:hypothetical protein